MTLADSKKNKNERGISLLIVLLVGTLMLMTSVAIGQYATRMVRSLQTRSDAIQNLYTAEQAFDCVRYWLNVDYRHFSNMISSAVPPNNMNPICNGVSYNFPAGTDTAADGENPSYSGGLGRFRIPFDPADPTGEGVFVEVERDISVELFDGFVRVYSQSGALGGTKVSERYQEYDYFLLYGADVMFVVDRSGSIEGREQPLTDDTEWSRLINSVSDSIYQLMSRVPVPHVGLVSFGTDASDTGRVESGNLVPDVKLTSNYNSLVNTATGEPRMSNTDESATNLSLGLSIAGAQLMRKYYPLDGSFERFVFNGGSLNNLPNDPGSGDRDEPSYPDVIVVITDGAPNGIMTHVPTSNYFYSGNVMSNNNFPDPPFIVPTDYNIGDAKIMRTEEVGGGRLIVDFHPSVPLIQRYRFCYDGGVRPGHVSSPLSNPVKTDTFPHYAMCNSTYIANKLKDQGISIIAVFVTTDDTACDDPPVLPPEAQWLRNDFVSDSQDGPLFAAVCDYTDVRKAVMYLFERMSIVESR